jgi:hypothetical protein
MYFNNQLSPDTFPLRGFNGLGIETCWWMKGLEDFINKSHFMITEL